MDTKRTLLLSSKKEEHKLCGNEKGICSFGKEGGSRENGGGGESGSRSRDHFVSYDEEKNNVEKAAMMSLLLLEQGFSNLAKLSQRVSLKDGNLVPLNNSRLCRLGWT